MAQVHTSMLFLEPWHDKIENPFLRSGAPDGYESSNFEYQRQNITVTDIRNSEAQFRLDDNGFMFVKDSNNLTPEVLQRIRNKERKFIEETYYQDIMKLVRDTTGASRVVVFDHVIRQRMAELAGKNPDGMGTVTYLADDILQVHVDQSPVGAVRRVHQMMGDEAPDLLRKRCQIINVWRPLRGPVDDWPLAVMDAGTLLPANCHPTLLWRQSFDFRGSTMFITHESAQKWYFLHGQTTDELTLIKIWDNKEGIAAKCCPHCAFEDPRTLEGADMRESIEVRCLVFYDEEVTGSPVLNGAKEA